MMTTEQLAEELLSLWRILRGLSHPVRHAEITPEQYWLLRLLSRAGPLSIGELASQLGIAMSSATSACKRLEKAGLLTRARRTEDERVVQVALTEQGRARIEAWKQRKREALTKLLSVLDQHEQEELQRMLERVLEAAGAHEINSGCEQERQVISHDSHN
ncbi:MAG: MarR family winged helix-turn-helix transcriptional regulator [Ktedonobacteraceae bacterium]|jgi:DNA-binding MarR family transcriptional regulator